MGWLGGHCCPQQGMGCFWNHRDGPFDCRSRQAAFSLDTLWAYQLAWPLVPMSPCSGLPCRELVGEDGVAGPVLLSLHLAHPAASTDGASTLEAGPGFAVSRDEAHRAPGPAAGLKEAEAGSGKPHASCTLRTAACLPAAPLAHAGWGGNVHSLPPG